jgi:hypothetical protein
MPSEYETAMQALKERQTKDLFQVLDLLADRPWRNREFLSS